MVQKEIPLYRRFVGQTPAQIKKESDLIFPNPERATSRDLVNIIERAAENEAVVLDERFATSDKEAQSFKKYGPNLLLFGETPDYQAIEQRLSPTHAIPQA